MTPRRPCKLPFQRISNGYVVCLLCAKVMAVRQRGMHKKGIEHKSAKQEWLSQQGK